MLHTEDVHYSNNDKLSTQIGQRCIHFSVNYDIVYYVTNRVSFTLTVGREDQGDFQAWRRVGLFQWQEARAKGAREPVGDCLPCSKGQDNRINKRHIWYLVLGSSFLCSNTR